MPLMHKKSKAAFEHNVKAEMHAGKPQKQALAIAYSTKRRSKKASGGTVESGSRDMNMAEGGEISASNERRPTPDNTYDDAKMASKNRHQRNNGQDGWTDKPTEAQAVNNSGRMVKPIKRPKMVPTDAFSTKMYDEEGHLESSASPGPYGEKPASDLDEDGANRQGPEVRDMAPEHSTKRKPYAKGGEVESSDYNHSPNKYEDDLTDLPPSEDEASEYARGFKEGMAAASGNDISDMESQHNSGRKPYAKGGHIQFDEGEEYDRDEEMNPAHGHYSADDSESQPEPEASDDEEDSIAAAIMSRKERPTRTHSDSDIDTMVAMAHGGEILEHESADDILSHDSIYSNDSDQVDLTRNADEDANEEDQLSWNALRKPNYNTSYWDEHQPDTNESTYDHEEMDSHDAYDMSDDIRRKMKAKRQFKDR